MSTALAGSLAVLALIDSTSFGTLLIPVWLLLAPGRVRVGRLLLFLATVAGFYFLVGLALVAGALAFLGDLDALLDNPLVTRAQLVLGVGLFVWSFFLGKKKDDDGRGGEGAADARGQARPGRMLRWRQRAMAETGDRSAVVGVMGLALGAAVVEVATMLPYLAATGLIGTADLPVAQRVAVLAGYCLVMVAPALVLLAARAVAGRWVQPLLQRIARWMEKNGAETTAWIVGIVGFLIARDAFGRMPDMFSFLDGLG